MFVYMVVVSKYACVCRIHYIIFYDKTLATFVVCKILILNVFTKKLIVSTCLFPQVSFVIEFAALTPFCSVIFVAAFPCPSVRRHACAK